MKKTVRSMACAAMVVTTMLLQNFAPSVALAAKMVSEEPEVEVTVETSATSETSDETSSVETTEPSDTSADFTIIAETEDLTETEADVTEVTEETVISSETNTDPTDETVVESEETEETEEVEEIEYVVFDHYYTEIDENLVNTSELFVVTTDSSVFTRNTNVVSNYDDAYIISCDSVEEARFVYSYYVDKVAFITDMSDSISVCTDDENVEDIEETTEPVEVEETSAETATEETEVTETDETTATTAVTEQEPDIADLSDLNNGDDAIANLNDIDTVHNDFSGYIALIDTGADATANYSVIGDDTSDNNGHGSQMLGYILEENPYANVVSIKVSEDGNASAADIYAGFRLAIDLNVSVINFSMTGLDREQNAIIKTIIQEALDAGIVVIGSAGNNGVSAKIFIPGSIDGVITIGAVDEYGIKIARSNYNADYYVVANSTSEAAARYTGIYTAGLASISLKVFDQVIEDDDYIPEEYQWAYDAAELMTDHLQETYGYGFVEVLFNEDGTPAWRFCMDETSRDGFFSIAAGGWDINTDATTDLGSVSVALAPGTYNGQCDFVRDASGKGHVTNFDNEFGAWLNTVGAGNVGFICSKYFSEVDDSSQSAGASSLEDGRLYYQAECTDTGSGLRILITISDRSDMSQPNWDQTATGYQDYTVEYVDSSHIHVIINGRVSDPFDLRTAATQVTAAISTYVNDTVATEYSGKKGITVTSTGFAAPSSGSSSRTCTATYTYNVASGAQVYAGLVTTGIPQTSGRVQIGKVNGSGQFLPGATIVVSGPFDTNNVFVNGQSGNATITSSSITFTTGSGLVTIRGLMPGSNYSITETTPPTGYTLPSVRSVTFETNGDGNPINATYSGEWSWDGSSFTYTLTNNRSGGLVFNKVAESGSGDVAGAGIFFAAATTNIAPNPFSGMTVSSNATWYTAGQTITMPDGSTKPAPADGYYFVTNSSGDDFTANNVVAGATYIFTEIYVPSGYGKAGDIIVTVDGQGNISPNSGAITMIEPGSREFGSFAIVKIVDSTNQFGFFNDIYGRSDSSLTWGYPLVDWGYNALDFSVRWMSADPDWTADALAGRVSWNVGILATGRLDGNRLEQRVMWAPGNGYDDYVAGIGDNVGPGLPFRWMAASGESTWELDEYSTSALGYLAPGYYYVTESWSTGFFGPFRGDTNAQALYVANMNAGGWECIENTGLHQTWRMIYHVTPNGTYRSASNGTTMVDSGTLEHRDGDNYNELDDGRDMRYAQPLYVDYTTCRNVNESADFDVTKIDASGMGVDSIEFSLWHGNQEIALGYCENANSPTQTDEGDLYEVTWMYQKVYPAETPGDDPTTADADRVWDAGVYNFYEVYAPERRLASWIVRNNAYRDNGDGEWGDAPANYPIPSSYVIPNLRTYWVEPNDPLYWRVEHRDNDLIPALEAYYHEGGSNGGLGYNSHYAGAASSVAGLPLGDYQIREYYDPTVAPFDVPDGWSGPAQDSDGRYYFYRDIRIDSAYTETVYHVTVVNEVLGRIDLTKVNLTGGPLSDLSFEILDDSNTVIATGLIPSDATPQTTGTGRATDYTYSAVWNQNINGRDFNNRDEAVTGLGTFTVREYVPVRAFAERDDLIVSSDWTYGGVTTHNGEACYYFSKTVVIDDNNASDTQTVTIRNEIQPTISTTMLDERSSHITVVGENIVFTDTVSYEGAYSNGSYEMHARLMTPIYDTDGNIIGAQPVTDRSGNYYENTVPFTASSTGSGTVAVSFTVNTANLVEAVQLANGVVQYSPKLVVCYESMTLVGGYVVATHNDASDTAQTVNIPNPEIGTTFTDLQTYEHQVPTGRIVEVVDSCSYTNLHIGEHYSMTCFLYDQTTGEQLMYSDNTPVVGRLDDFVPQTESGTVNVTFTIDTSDLLVNVFAYEERPLVAFEYLRTSSGILIGGHTDIDDIAQHNTIPTPPPPRSSLIDDQTGTHEGVIGAAVPVTDTVWFTNLNIGESYQIRGYIVDRDAPTVVYATQTVDFVPTTRDGTVDVHFMVDTSWVCEGNREAYLFCIEEIWQLDTQNTGRGEVRLARENDPRNQDQQIHLVPECHTTMNDVVTQSHYGMIGTDVVLEDTVAYSNLHVGESYTVTGVLMDKQTGLPVMQNGQPVTSQTTFVAPTQDGTVVVTYHVDTLALIQQIGQTVNGISISAPREVVSFETITSTSNYDFAIHSDINDEGQTIIIGDITSHAGDLQTSTSWLASGLTTVRDTVHYRGLGPVEYTLRGSLHLVEYDDNGQPIDGGLIYARPGEVTELEYTWTPSNHEGDVNFDFKLDSNRYQGRNIVVFEELWYNGTCIVSHENYADSFGNYGMNNLEQTVHVASVWTSAFSFQSGEQLLAYTTDATVTDFAYCGNLDIGQSYYCEASLWACYTDENGYIHNVPLTQEEGGIACSPVFTATENHAIAEVTFHIDATKYFDEGYDYLLVSERLIHVGSGVCIATHSDLTSKEQSINIPGLHTTATTECGHTLPESSMSDVVPVTVTDRVYYENLICDGRSYTVVGNLQYARTDAQGNITESGPLMQNGQPVTNSVTFVPTSSTGYIDVEFQVNAADIAAHGYNRIVAFEDLYYGPEGIRVGTHSDIYDQDQTIYVPGTPTPTPPVTPPDTPKTGDESGYGNYVAGAIVAVTLLASGITLLVILYRRKKY